MAITTITRVENRSPSPVTLLNVENPHTPGYGVAIAPGGHLAVHMDVPWAKVAADFPGHHLELQVAGQTRYWFWQADQGDGDYVRLSGDGSWQDPGAHVHGVAAVGGDRTIVVLDGCCELVAFPDDLAANIRTWTGAWGFRLCDTQPPAPLLWALASAPKYNAVAFSMAGMPSDAYRAGQPGARFLYRDSGKRYAFRIENGVVHAYHPDGSVTVLDQAVSYTRRRAGERTPQAFLLPPFDLIAASAGRVFAKAQGQDRFFFATMDHMFIQGGAGQSEFAVPSTYFKLDPEFGQAGAQMADLTAPLAGCFADHPAAERFPIYRFGLELNLMDVMVVAVQPRVWHLVDTRPPLSVLNAAVVGIELVRQVIAVFDRVALWAPFLSRLRAALDGRRAALEATRGDLEGQAPAAMAPPAWVPACPYVAYCDGTRTVTLSAICYQKVLDLGVGHVHWHEQYDGGTGGELQPMQAGPVLPVQLPMVTYAYLYRFANGPVRDGDGYIDGTCNFYTLVQLKDDAAISADPHYRRDSGAGVADAYGLLFIDEQSYFTQRWHLVHPADAGYLGGGFALALALRTDATQQPPLYNWRPDSYWCPFRAGHIGRWSRLAVARQVLLVTGEDESGTPAIYSINFSYATMDRTWRWRALPAAAVYVADAETAAGEQMPPTDSAGCYPQTLRLREDMTLHLQGTRRRSDGVLEAGHWYQRYLPFNNQLVPPAEQLVPATPPTRPRPGYTHAWKFLPAAAFACADRFSHLGVYDLVDSRTQTYVVQPASGADTAALQAGGAGPWVDGAGTLYVRAWKFWWAAPLQGLNIDLRPNAVVGYEGRPIKQPPSIFNPETRLRIVARAGQLIAMAWDKRDADLLPFDDLPMRVDLQNGAARATVTLQPGAWIEMPPLVQRAELRWPAAAGQPVVLALSSPYNVWRVRLAALDASRPSGVVSLLDLEFASAFASTGDGFQVYSWTPAPAAAADLERYCMAADAGQYAASVWLEDVVGHVAVPEEVHWLRTLQVSMTPSAVPLGLPVLVTVHAADARTGAPVAGRVTLDGQVRGTTEVPFTYTFTVQTQRVFDPETRTWRRETTEPSGSVSADGYGDTNLALPYYTPQLRVTVDPARIRTGPPVSLTVGATDATTGAPVAGRVWIAGADRGPTNTPFPYAFAPGVAGGTVIASGYPHAAVTFGVYTAQLRVWVDPGAIVTGRAMQVTVHAVDASSGAPVTGRVTVNGHDVGATNASLAYTFGGSPPPGTVSAPYYADAPIAWPPFHAPQLVVAIQPHPVPLNSAIQATVQAWDVDSRAPVDGTVRMNGNVVGRTNVPSPYTFRMQRVRTFDPETRTWTVEWLPPTATVSATGYPDAAVDLGIAAP